MNLRGRKVMKRVIVVLVSLALLLGPTSIFIGANEDVGDPLSPGPGPRPGAQVYYTSRATFDADTGPLPFFEDFEEGNVNASGPFGGVLDETTDNGYFKPGDIEPGIRLQDNPGPDSNGLVLIYGGIGPPTKTVTTNTFVDSMDIFFFNNDTKAVGMDLQSFLSPTTFDISIYGIGGVLLDIVQAPADNTGIFWGVISTELITRINLYSATETDGADNIAFGDFIRTIDHVEVTPNPTSIRLGCKRQFTATAFDLFNVPIPGVEFIWDTDVGTVNATGFFTAQGTPGTGFVIATNNTYSGIADVTVYFSDFSSHHWKLDEVSGPIAYDSDAEDHGTIHGASMNQPGKVGTSYHFDGLDDHIEVPDNSTLDFMNGDDIAIFAWINTTDANGRFLSKRLVPGDAKGYLMQIQNGKFGAYLDFGSTGAYIESSFNVNDGLWHRVGVTRIGNVMECFVDGASIGTNPNGAGDLSNSNPLLIGAEQGLTMYFEGYIDDVVFGFPPTADAGPDQTVAQHELVTFDGSGSHDDGGITNYWWNFTDGGPVTLTGMNPTYAFASEGIFNVELTVMDTMGQVDFDDMRVTVTDGDPPVAMAGPDQADLPGATIFFDGSNSYDPGHLGEPIDDGIVSWVWDFVDGVPVQYTGPTPSHTFANSGEYVVTLTVTDQVGLNGTDTMTVTINDVFDIDVSQAASSGDWILVSFPNKVEGDPLTIFQDLDGDTTWDIAQWYDPSAPVGANWKTTATFKPAALNDFTYVNNSMGFWVHITSYGDGIIRIVGDLADSGENANLYLHPGWNLVGYPFATAQQSMWTFGTSFVIDTVNAYSQTNPYRLRNFDWFMEMHRPGRGYFAHATGDEVLVITAP